MAFLRHKITSGEWPINTRIPKEPELAAMLGVGMSTVREAVRSLSVQGMLEPIKGVGTFVRARTPPVSMLGDFLAAYSLDEILIYRRALEIEAAQLAAANRTDAQLQALRASFEHDLEAETDGPRSIERGETPGPFHHLIFEAAGSELLAGLYASVMGAIRGAMHEGTVVFGASHDLRQLDHRAILEAIELQDVPRAAHAMALHADRDLVPDNGLHPPRPTARMDALQDGSLTQR